MAQILLKNLTKTFDDKVTAVKNVTIDIADQELMVIVGPSGCGKTTILRMIAGLEEPTSGSITIGDTVVNDIPPKARDIAMVFQNFALYPHMTVFENMAFALKLRKYPKAELKKAVTHAAELLGIEDLLDRKPQALSGGQRQRVALGRAIVRNPRVFLFDEPLSNLDANLRLTTRTEIKALHRKLKATTIYVTHDQAEAMTLGDRICVMYNGVIQQIDTPLRIYDHPVNRFVAGFLGTPQMNFFEGRIQFMNDNPYFVTGNDNIKLPARMRDTLKNYKDENMVLGVRPENIYLKPVQGQDECGFESTVTLVESLGNRTDICLKTSTGYKFVASAHSAFDVHESQKLKVYINMVKIHIFELGDIGRNTEISL